jgi:predicted kinase
MQIIVNLRGTSGSGKSTAVRQFLERYETSEVKGDDGKVIGYKIIVPHLANPLYAIGRYETACGGMDTIKTQQECVDRVMNAYRAGGNVLCEGLMLTGVGDAGTFIRQVGGAVKQNLIIANLDTPVELCIERVKQRRLTAGNEKEFNPENTISKHKQMVSADRRLRAAGYNVVNIDYRDVHNQLQQLFFEADPHADYV